MGNKTTSCINLPHQFSTLPKLFNVIRFAELLRNRKWERQQFVHSIFEDDQGSHSVYSRITGDRPVLVLLHGYGGTALVQWYDTALLLKEEYDLVIPDLMCSAQSLVRDNDYSIEGQVKHILAILNFLKIDQKVILCGNSYGGVVSANFANQFPDRVSRLVLYDAPVKFYSIAYAQNVAIEYGVDSIHDLLSPPSPQTMKKALRVIYYKLPLVPDFVYDHLFESSLLQMRDEQLKLLDHSIANEQRYRAIDYKWMMPVNLIWGEFDKLVPLTTAEELMEAYKIPQDHLVVIPNAAHAANMELPKVFCKVLLEMIKD